MAIVTEPGYVPTDFLIFEGAFPIEIPNVTDWPEHGGEDQTADIHTVAGSFVLPAEQVMHGAKEYTILDDVAGLSFAYLDDFKRRYKDEPRRGYQVRCPAGHTPADRAVGEKRVDLGLCRVIDIRRNAGNLSSAAGSMLLLKLATGITKPL